MKKTCSLLVLMFLLSGVLSHHTSIVGSQEIAKSPDRGPGDYLNFTYLENGRYGSTAYRVTDGSVVIYIAAFPNSSYCKLKPDEVSDADIIIEEHHGHNTHYDPDSVHAVQNSSDAMVVGNSQVIWDMEDRKVDPSRLVRMEPTASSKVSTTLADHNVKITAYLMPHTGSPTIDVLTFLIEMPNGMKWFHGGCYSDSGDDVSLSMKAHSELSDIDVMLLDFDHDLDSVDTYFRPMVIGKIHDYSTSPWVNTVWEDYPSGDAVLSHGDFFIYPPDYPVHVTGGDFTPYEGDTNTTFSFDVSYRYRPNTGPTSVRIHLDGEVHEMATTGNDFRIGVTYSYETKLTFGSDHEYHIEVEADSTLYRIPETGKMAGPVVNSIPSLENVTFDPPEGNTDTEFTFSLLYTDLDGTRPLKANIHIDGSSYIMTADSDDFASGVTYSFRTSLPIGQHDYYLVFSDGKTEVRFPPEGEISGPYVVRANYAPLLTLGKVDPGEGHRSQMYTFSVRYLDGEGDHATDFKVVIDDDPMNMTSSGGDPSEGITYRLSTSLLLGLHLYHFEFSDGVFDVRLPAEGEFTGPNVTNILPHIRIDAPLDQDEFDDGHPVHFNASGSYDDDGDNLSFTWSSDLDGEIGTGAVMDALLSAGEHTITLTLDDRCGGVATRELTVTVIHLYVDLDISISMAPKEPGEGEEVSLAVKVKNVGNKPVRDLTILLLLDDTTLISRDVESIIDGGSVDIFSEFTAMVGDHVLNVDLSDGAGSYLNFTVAERPPPVADAGDDITTYVGEEVCLDGSNSTGTNLVFHWTIGNITQDGGVFSYFTPGAAGTIGIILTVTDDLGKTSTDTLTLTVEQRPEQPVVEDKADNGGFDGMLAGAGAAVLALIIIGATFIFLTSRRRKDNIEAPRQETPLPPPQADLSHLPPELRPYYQGAAPPEGALTQEGNLPYGGDEMLYPPMDPQTPEGAPMMDAYGEDAAAGYTPPGPGQEQYALTEEMPLEGPAAGPAVDTDAEPAPVEEGPDPQEPPAVPGQVP